MPSSGMWGHVVLVRADVSEEHMHEFEKNRGTTNLQSCICFGW
jgi:hypothetical protein